MIGFTVVSVYLLTILVAAVQLDTRQFMRLMAWYLPFGGYFVFHYAIK